MTAAITTRRFEALGTTASIVLTDPEGIGHAEHMLRARLDDLDRAASRFRADSELSGLAARAGRPAAISPLLTALVAVALRAAALTDGLVDPTVGQALVDAGYDRDFPQLATRVAPRRPALPVPGWQGVRLDVPAHEVLVPVGVRLDLGATAKAAAADWAASAIAAELGCGVLVELGGDVAVSGRAPHHGWALGVGEAIRDVPADDEPVIAIRDGGIATSSTTARTWRRAAGTAHHIIDPRTGEVAEPVWRTVSVAAASCLDANTASTAAVVLGAAAPGWLDELDLPTRLVALDGREHLVAGWPGQTAPVTPGLR